jgi:hypothetical protein
MRSPAMAAAAAVLALALAACGSDEPDVEGDLDASAQTACDEVARWSADGYPEDEREEVLATIAEAAADTSIAEIQAPSDELANAAGGSATAYEAPVDELAAACVELGWEGANGR